MSQRDRVVLLAEEVYPGCIVTLVGDSGTYVRFSITRNGDLLTNAHPHFTEAELEQMNDDELRRLIRTLCGRGSSSYAAFGIEVNVR